MIRRIQACSKLAFDESYIDDRVRPHPLGEIYELRSAPYFISKLFPYQRLIGQNPVAGSAFRGLVPRTNRPDDGCEFVNEKIHWSAIERFGEVARENGREQRYEPENLAVAIRNLPVADEREGGWPSGRLLDEPAMAA